MITKGQKPETQKEENSTMKGQLKIYQMLAIFLVLSPLTVSAQDDGFIYGKITTIDGDEYQGALRWGKEEAYWTDMFNAEKEENENLEYLSRDEYEYLRESKYRGHRDNDSWRHWTKASWWDDDWDNDRFLHRFTCQFGELKSIRPRSRDRVDIELQNGTEFILDGDGYNDIGGQIKIADSDLGIIDISWSRIESIEFMATPKKLEDKFGEPLYGKVQCEIGSFTGYIQWDHDERVSSDKLDGDNEDGDLSIAFGKIKSIERIGYSRSEVTLNSGRKLELRGSNDVNDENRGIIVTIKGLGRIDIPWKEFDRVDFMDAPNSGKSYSQFKSQNELTASVETTNGDQHSGKLIFDLDEEYDFEVLEGSDDDIEFIIPFRNIASIQPKNYEYSEVITKDGEEYFLGESQDVSDRNNGLIVFKGREPIYIPWNKVEKIDFK